MLGITDWENAPVSFGSCNKSTDGIRVPVPIEAHRSIILICTRAARTIHNSLSPFDYWFSLLPAPATPSKEHIISGRRRLIGFCIAPRQLHTVLQHDLFSLFQIRLMIFVGVRLLLLPLQYSQACIWESGWSTHFSCFGEKRCFQVDFYVLEDTAAGDAGDVQIISYVCQSIIKTKGTVENLQK